jgi:hypothetical protein
MTLGAQFGALMKERIATLAVKAGYPIAEDIAQRMKENTNAGRAFEGEGAIDLYDKNYSPKYAQKRKNRGLQTEHVTLRTRNLRIERTTQPQTEGANTAVIGFVDGGRIFKYHQDGINYRKVGRRIRSIFPQTIASVPADIMAKFKLLIVEVLSGRK